MFCQIQDIITYRKPRQRRGHRQTEAADCHRIQHRRIIIGDFASAVLAILGVAAKLERRRIAERTARGRADAKAKGVQFGRKPALTSHQQQGVRKMTSLSETQLEKILSAINALRGA